VDPSTAIGSILPAAWIPFLAVVPVVQVIAKLLSPLPGYVGNYTHGTVWSRTLDAIAAFPARPAARPLPPSPVVAPPSSTPAPPAPGAPAGG